MADAHRFEDLPPDADEVDIARASLGLGRTDEWKAISVTLEREGFPPRDPLMGGRYRPGIQAWFAKRPARKAQIAPGLSWRPGKDGKTASGWRAKIWSKAARIATKCRVLQAEMLTGQ